jgi:pimeloyl-ACP methyl ester carboxylesterase
MKTQSNGINIEYEWFGEGANKPCVVLIMGLGMQMIAWPMPLIDALVSNGYRVLRFDNRDIGLSTWFDQFGMPNLAWNGLRLSLGLTVHSAYSLEDMAQDTIGLLEALEIDGAHIVGASMGGMIAQLVAVKAPQRVHSLTSIMSTTGRRSLPGPSIKARKALLSRPRNPHDIESVGDHSLRTFRIIGSPNNPESDKVIRDRLMLGLKRAYHPAGAARQLMAIAADGSRVDRLRKVQAPTLVIHGVDDPLVPIACGRDTAASIQGSKFVEVAGMGHDFAPQALAAVSTHLVQFLAKTKINAFC